jgi:hypothetical protein
MAVAEPAAFGLFEGAALLGTYSWVERRLFELTGAWAAQAELPAVRLFLDRSSLEHAWHAELLAQRLPVLRGVDPASFQRPLGALGPLVDSLEELWSRPEPVRSPAVLAGLGRLVLPALLDTYRAHLERAVPWTDGPAMRALRLVMADEEAAQGDAEALLIRWPLDEEASTTLRQAIEARDKATAALEGHLVEFPAHLERARGSQLGV